MDIERKIDIQRGWKEADLHNSVKGLGRMKWYQAIETAAGRGLRVVFENGERLTMGIGFDGRLQIVTDSVAGLEVIIGANSQTVAIAPKASGNEKRKRDAAA